MKVIKRGLAFENKVSVIKLENSKVDNKTSLVGWQN
jgi:hypothetical protein